MTSDTDLRHYIITLHRRDDLESFYHDMENPGGPLHIPNRRVELLNRRTISRNTHYRLTYKEALELREDPRVLAVELDMSETGATIKNLSLANWEFNSCLWQKSIDSPSVPTTKNEFPGYYLNWGLIRSSERTNRINWLEEDAAISTTPPGFAKTIKHSTTCAAIWSRYSGQNVDVVIVDGAIAPSHPEFAANPDGTGTSRVIQRDWFERNIALGKAPAAFPYRDYMTDDGNHGAHVAGIVAGNTQGYVRSAAIYNMVTIGTGVGLSFIDYLEDWHVNVKRASGNFRPTVINWSQTANLLTIDYSNDLTTPIEYLQLGGVQYTAAQLRGLTRADLNTFGFFHGRNFFHNLSGVYQFISPAYITVGFTASLQDAINSGLVLVSAAGNSNMYRAAPGNSQYNDHFKFKLDPTLYYIHRSTNNTIDGITVGNLSGSLETEGGTKRNRVSDTSDRGPGIDIWAPGENIYSAENYNSTTWLDSRNLAHVHGPKTGTSMAAPQVAGVAALIMAANPNWTPAQVKTKIIADATLDQVLDTNYPFNATTPSLYSLWGSPNKILYTDYLKSKYRVDSVLFSGPSGTNTGEKCTNVAIENDSIYETNTFLLRTRYDKTTFDPVTFFPITTTKKMQIQIEVSDNGA